jgi:hypothetical protein
MDAGLISLEQCASHRRATTVELSVAAPVRAVPEAVARGTMRLRQVPWLMVATGMLLEVPVTRIRARPTAQILPHPEGVISAAPWAPPAKGSPR